MKDFFELKWGECDMDDDIPMNYVSWICKYCKNVNSGKSTTCLKCGKKAKKHE